MKLAFFTDASASLKKATVPKKLARKGQMGIMEYIMLTFMIMVVIVMLIFFLSGWQVSQAQIESSKARTAQVLSLTKSVLNSPLFARDDSMLDDVKLTALLGKCQELKEVFPGDWFIEVEGYGTVQTLCQSGSYDPGCNYWQFCKREGRFDAYTLPVNIYRRAGETMTAGFISRTEIGKVTVGVYHG
jgi:hypothetical protein